MKNQRLSKKTKERGDDIEHVNEYQSQLDISLLFISQPHCDSVKNLVTTTKVSSSKNTINECINTVPVSICRFG